jgi:hypothetical protein
MLGDPGVDKVTVVREPLCDVPNGGPRFCNCGLQFAIEFVVGGRGHSMVSATL